MNRVRAGYPGQLNDLATLRREPADTACFLDKRSNRSLHHSSNLSSMLLSELPPLLRSFAVKHAAQDFACGLPASLSLSFTPAKRLKLAAGERIERPYPDSKSRVLPLDDPASRFQRDCFHAPHAQDRRFIDVMAEPPAIFACTID